LIQDKREKKQEQKLLVTFTALIYSVWRERNVRIFPDKQNYDTYIAQECSGMIISKKQQCIQTG